MFLDRNMRSGSRISLIAEKVKRTALCIKLSREPASRLRRSVDPQPSLATIALRATCPRPSDVALRERLPETSGYLEIIH